MDQAVIKLCGGCSLELPTTSFAKAKRTKDGLQTWCKSCQSAYLKRPDQIAKRKTRWQDGWPTGKNKDRFLRKNYGITMADYNVMLKEQGDRCKICGVPQSECTRQLAVDHCHATGKVRGLLCNKCNAGIGNLGDSPALLALAIDYLKANEQQHYKPFTFCG